MKKSRPAQDDFRYFYRTTHIEKKKSRMAEQLLLLSLTAGMKAIQDEMVEELRTIKPKIKTAKKKVERCFEIEDLKIR